MNKKWQEEFGEAARRLATHSNLTNLELGISLEHIYARMDAESMRDAREEVNRKQHEVDNVS